HNSSGACILWWTSCAGRQQGGIHYACASSTWLEARSDVGPPLHRHCPAMELRCQGRDSGLSSPRLVWRILDRPRQPRRRAEEQGPQGRGGRTFGLEVDGLGNRQRSCRRQEQFTGLGRPFTGREQRDRNGSSAREGKNPRRLTGYVGATVAGPSARQCSAGDQLLPFTGLGGAGARGCWFPRQALERQSRR